MNEGFLLFTVLSFFTFVGWITVAALGVYYEIRVMQEQQEEEAERMRALYETVMRELR